MFGLRERFKDRLWTEAEKETSRMTDVKKSIFVGLVAAILTAGSYFMIGPQIMIIVPAAILAGIIFAVRRSFLSLVCFGYCFTFGLVVAYIGCAELPDYERTTGFAVAVAVGMAGVTMIAVGLWNALPKGKIAGEASRVVEQRKAADSR